jgi:glycoside/pentoside/hexuronide:cation symporter, GPH family
MTTTERPKFGWGPKLLFSSGGAAVLIKRGAIDTFLLVFYNQAIGLPPQWVGTAIMIALVFDAVVDPTIGQISDNFRSRWGRRHPFIYASAIPFAVVFVMLWNPPSGVSDAVLFGYLLVSLLLIRLLDTFFELPSTALVPELAPGYDERTTLISLRTIFGLLGGLAMTLLAYQVFMREGPGGTGGITERDGYLGYSLTAAAVIVVTVLVSALATHRYIPFLTPAPSRRLTPRRAAREIFETLKNRNFAVLIAMGMLNAIAGGLHHSLTLYFSLYYWGLSQAQLSVLALVGVLTSLVGVVLAPFAGVRMGKKWAAIILYIVALCFMAGPVFLRVIGVAPPNGTTAVFAMIIAASLVSQTLAIATTILLLSMLNDVVEEAEVATGRRSEGLVLSADQLFKKMVSGVGVFFSGMLLAYINFPKDAQRGAVDPEVLNRLALGYLPVFFLFAGGGAAALLFLRTTRESHAANLRTLQERRARPLADPSPEGQPPGAAGAPAPTLAEG